jgi:hypothetical protein
LEHGGGIRTVIQPEDVGMLPTSLPNATAKGDDIKVVLNGETIVDANLKQASKDGTVDHRKHPGLSNKTGYIGFLGHGAQVEFRNIRIKGL